MRKPREPQHRERVLSGWEIRRMCRKVGKPGGLSFPMFCKMFGWADPKYAMIYCNPSMDEVADLL